MNWMNSGKTSIRSRLFGDRLFYKTVLSVAVPMMIQNGISNLVNLLDNVMVGQLGTESVSGVAIANQLFFVFMLSIFGGLSGAGIFTAQYVGQKDDEGVRYTFRFKFILAMILTAIAVCLFAFAGIPLLSAYLTGEGDTQTALAHGRTYLNIILIGIPAFALSQTYATTLRECGETVVPMKAGVASVLVNLVFNYLLIYGKFGFPALGVAGAAIATALSRYVELAVVVIWSHTHSDKVPFVRGLYRSMHIPGTLLKRIILKGSPLLFNEFLWSAGMAILLQCYSVRGLDAVAGMNISTTINKTAIFLFIIFTINRQSGNR